MTDEPQTPQLSLGTAAARNLARTSKSAPQMQGITTSLALLGESVAQLRRPTRELLLSLKNATPELRRLVLLTSPFGVRAELIAHGFATDDSDAGGRACEVTGLGLAALQLYEPSIGLEDADAGGRYEP